METKSEGKKTIKVSVLEDGTLLQDDLGRKWFLEGIVQPEIAMTIMIANTLTSMYESELSQSDEFEVTLSIKRKE